MKAKKIFTFILTGGILLTSGSAFAMPTDQFDAGVEKGISYFNQGLYYEARDEFQWFADSSWGQLNINQQQYILDYLDGIKQEINRIEMLSTAEFDEGMAKGISYFNQGLYCEAKDEFQWFADSNWGRLNGGQQQYLLDYLGGAKQEINRTFTGTYTTYGSSNDIYIDYFDGSKISFSIYSVNSRATRIASTDTITATVKSGVCHFRFEDSRGGYGTGTLKIYKNKLVLAINYTEYGLGWSLSDGTYLKK